ncbi:MAG: hypothetical protein AB2792_14605 [Candidatus Thiodiazotropha sp.]
MRKWGELALILFAAVSLSSAVWQERTALQLLIGGTADTATILSVEYVREESLLNSRYGTASGPSSVSTYRFAYRFNPGNGQIIGATEMNYYEVYKKFPGFSLVDITAPVGQSVDILYSLSDPSINAVDHPLPWSPFWYLITFGGIALPAGIGLLIERKAEKGNTGS